MPGAATTASAGAQAAPGAYLPQRSPAGDLSAAPQTVHVDSRTSVFFETAEAESAREPMLLHNLEEMLDKFGELPCLKLWFVLNVLAQGVCANKECSGRLLCKMQCMCSCNSRA